MVCEKGNNVMYIVFNLVFRVIFCVRYYFKYLINVVLVSFFNSLLYKYYGFLNYRWGSWGCRIMMLFIVDIGEIDVWM